MARILLIRPPSVFSASSYSSPVTMPLALAYLSANLLKHGHSVENIDALGEDINHIDVSYSPRVRYRGLSTPAILGRIKSRPDGIGVSVMFSQDWPHVEDMINAIHQRYPDVPIILGGEHATAASEYVLRSCPAVNFISLGEGEETIVDWADWLDGKKPVEQIAGIQFLSKDKSLQINPPRPRLRTPDDLPLPAWQLFNLEPYFQVGEGHGVERGRSMPLVATRGCPYQCTFCSSPFMWTTRYVMRQVPKVVDEIEHYIERYKADNIDFFDLTAIVKKDWTLEFCREIKRRGLKFTWQLPSGTRSEAMDADVLKEMAEAGCMNVTYAPESGSNRTLKEIKKKVVLPRMFDSIRQAKRNGIFVKCNLIIGFPRETRLDMWKTLWCAIRFAIIGVDDTGVYPYSPYPGSELYHYLRDTGAIKEMDRSYFESLMTFMDLRQSSNYCENVGSREIAFYRFVGMSAFYGLSFLLHPSRVARSLRNYKEHKSDTVFEERLFAYLRRRKLEKGSAAAQGRELPAEPAHSGR
ncbi:MAG: B12-binding domain-containing radical SAM protein [Elusimicrobia bacterium]|nr:B12-binding domain-containing radical SAM protein [Elusimicrobiota bacterium]